MTILSKIEQLIFSKATVVIYLLTVVVLMFYSPVDTGVSNPIGMGELGDYIAHFLVFLPFMIGGDIVWGERLKSGWWFAAGALFVATLETCQHLLPYRSFNPYDMLLGELGLCVSWLLMILFRRLRRLLRK